MDKCEPEPKQKDKGKEDNEGAAREAAEAKKAFEAEKAALEREVEDMIKAAKDDKVSLTTGMRANRKELQLFGEIKEARLKLWEMDDKIKELQKKVLLARAEEKWLEINKLWDCIADIKKQRGIEQAKRAALEDLLKLCRLGL